MRGADEEQSQIFSYLSAEARVRKDPLRAIRAIVDEVLSETWRQFDAMYASPAVDSAGEVAAGAVAADAVFDPQRATADGGDGLKPAVPLVCGTERGRRGVGRDGVHHEPRSVAGS